MKQSTKTLLSLKVRLFLYFTSFCALLFSQNYCTNVCPFIDSVEPSELFINLALIFVFHIIVRELLFRAFPTPFQRLSLPRYAYYLSMLSWGIAGLAAMLLHFFLYPDFPIGSHLKLLSAYILLGAGILAQLEYIVFEKTNKRFQHQNATLHFSENISRRILESFLVFTIVPTATLVLIVARYYYDGLIAVSVETEVVAIGLMFVAIALVVAIIFGRMLSEDTTKIIKSIRAVENREYDNHETIIRFDELGDISHAIGHMSIEIKESFEEIKSLNEEIINTQKEVVYTMGEIAETRSKETGKHVQRVANYSQLLARKAGMDEKETDLLKLASPMHDVGKVGIPDAILNKPGKLTDKEFEVMKTHAQLGYDMLKHSNKPILQTAAIVALEHHEKYDGSGYPRGLKGEQIHIYGRITAVADVFDALGSERVYKKAWEDEKIFALLKEQSGKHFDPKLIELFFENLDEIFAIREKYKETLS